MASAPPCAHANADETPLCPCCHNYLCSPPERARPRAPSDRLSELPEDALEGIAAGCGSDLGRFAAVSKSMRALVERRKDELWKQAYTTKNPADDLEDEWGGETLPSSLWKACVLRESVPKQM
jgi:hypothetical protein